MTWLACTRLLDRFATIWTSTAWKIHTLIQLLKVGLLPGDGYPVGRDTTCTDESARCFRLVLFQTKKTFKSCRFGKICANGLSKVSNSPIPTQATTTTGEPAFHSSSPVVLQQLVQVIVEMGPHSRFAVELSDGSELTIQLLKRRFQRFSDDWLSRVVGALRNWQIWASKHCPPFPVEELYPTPHIHEQMTAYIMATTTSTLNQTR